MAAPAALLLRSHLLRLSQHDHKCQQLFQHHLAKENWDKNDRELVLQSCGQSLLDPQLTLTVGVHLRPWLLELLGRARTASVKTFQTGGGNTLHLALCVALSKLVTISNDAIRFVLKYFQEAPAPFQKTEDDACDEPTPKKLKRQKQQVHKTTDKELLQATYDLLVYVGGDLIRIWKWSCLLSYLHHNSEEVQWLACHCIAVLSRMSESQRESLIIKYVSLETHRILTVKNGLIPCQVLPPVLCDEEPSKSCAEFRHTVIVSGVTLPLYDRRHQMEGCLVNLPSTERNLESVALALCQGQPVLVEGVVGSGKTSLVEHLACVTGRTKAPYLIKVQLGDQTDSKTLLGTYCCTPTPGEFIWRPGSLTQAVTNGYWLLLEDLDYAPMDVISILVPLLESRTLPLPGHGNIRAHPDFQLFATRRTLGGTKMVSGCAGLLDKLWTTVTLETLTCSELLQLITTRWPKLESISEKLVAVYLMLSAGQHSDDSDGCKQVDIVDMTSIKVSGRLVSTRDLMKWCSRVSSHIDDTDIPLSNRAFQEALDCFCAAVPNPSTRFTFAVHIGSVMNRTKAEVEYYCTQYKPEVTQMPNKLIIGQRVRFHKKVIDTFSLGKKENVTFSFTRPAACLLERIGVAIMNQEPVLIVGETGTGKTSTVQYLAHQTRNKLRVINMNQQSDSTDLLGGFKPVEMKTIVAPVRQEFEDLFAATFSTSKNNKFLQHIMVCYVNQRWVDLFSLMEHTLEKALEKLRQPVQSVEQRKKNVSSVILNKWQKLRLKISTVKDQAQHAQSALAFSFIEGILIKAIQDGEWVLLDEINLANAETLECLSGLLESNSGSLTLLERGDNKPVSRHPDFRLFACMNPATDIGKKELPAGLRNRFTEFFMEELQCKQDIMIIINDYLVKLGPSSKQVRGIKNFYKKVKEESESKLTDGTGHKPHFSLRTLCRALAVAARNPCSSFPRSLYEAFCLSFLTQLDRTSYPAVVALIKLHVLSIDPQGKGNGKLNFKHKLDPIPAPTSEKAVQIEGYWVPQGDQDPQTSDNYIITQTVQKNLEDLVRIVSIGRFPVLLQGETSVGKTSLITYLACLSGNVCVRINNHEHTDLQEYIGCYAPDENGKLVFKEGALVKAMRKGHWIILDELNLAPSDVLEALNRLLDDNRELFIPETQETVHAHRRFMLFATQNPPGFYGGRKVLSRAFRNRFVELHFNEIPASELEVILHKRCEVPLSYSKKMVAVLQDLQNMRRGSNLFQGKQSFITLRDLFRWAERYRLAPKQTTKFYDWDQHLADEGYIVLAGRVRVEEESNAIIKVLEKRLKKPVDKSKLFSLSEDTSLVTKSCLMQMCTIEGFEHVVWTQDMRRLYVLTAKALSFGEPVLLVGDTGCGKTTVCQMIAVQNKQALHTVNCHMHTEGADFLGGLRPVRSHTDDDDRLFEWVDGPLIVAMKNGEIFLADEISLADDSVLERLNSVLEPERVLVLAEKGTDDGGDISSLEVIYAQDQFRLIGTMNPGGDYGKKELSPALRNRFTEIWCPKVEINRVASDVLGIIEHNVKKTIVLNTEANTSGFGNAILEFIEHFTKTDLGKKCVLSIRDLLSWVHFINKVASGPTCMDAGLAYIHGACLILLDGLGSGLTGSGTAGWKQLREASLNYLCQQVWQKTTINPSRATLQEEFVSSLSFTNTDTVFGIGPFMINKGSASECKSTMFTFKAPRTCINLLRLLRGLQLTKPLLLEGSPGVGKTSLVMALAKASGNDIVRINLSEQTDVSDLFGADLPIEGGKGGMFAWRDGPLLQALKHGSWVVFDELNLASQSVLEGLNACFDHRGEVFVPELGKTFHVEHHSTKVFACQNPQHEGGARKGLPKSFLNRFTQVHIEALSSADLEFILSMMYADLPYEIVSKMVEFNQSITSEILDQGLWGIRGGPWELNLRDMFRWCDIMIKYQPKESYNPGQFVGLIYSDRMRTDGDKKNVFDLYDSVFGENYPSYRSTGRFHITRTTVQVGHSKLNRNQDGDHSEDDDGEDLYVMHHQLPVMESLINCINMNWMSILVGESGGGKTSLVKLLARLTGHRLLTFTVNSDMDVTELLGGFQQVDYGRVLAEIVSDARCTAWAAIREALLIGEEIHVKKILLAWNKLVSAHNEKMKRTTSEETAHFHHQCNLLMALLETVVAIKVKTGTKTISHKNIKKSLEIIRGTCESSGASMEVVELCSRVQKLQECVKAAGGLSGGGTFHWVDSILVNAVRNGEWLLVDGVNLCSASVLDRLNALLEPGGVLTLSERGVVNGAVPSVAPHPKFRLFLLMNPQHGEISRAMRNRGIEIYMLGSWTSPQDLRALMLQGGLTSPHLQNALFQAHQAVTNTLPVYEQPSISKLKQVASLTSQLIQTGYHPNHALTKALKQVYLQSLGKFIKHQAVGKAIEEIVNLLMGTSDMPWPPYEDQVLSIHRLSRGSNLTQVRILGSLLHTLLLAIENQEAVRTWADATLSLPRPLPVPECGILHSLILILTTIPLNDWSLLHTWMSQLVSYLPPSAAQLGCKIVTAIQYAVSIGPCCASQALVANLGPDYGCDPRYNLQALTGKKKCRGIEFESLANKSTLWVWRTLFCFYKEPQIIQNNLNGNCTIDAMTVLEISHAINEGTIGKNTSPHVSVPLIVPFLNLTHTMIQELSNNTQTLLTDKEFCQLLSALRWCDCLYQLCCQVVKKSKFHLFLPQLTLHWQWIEEELLQKMPESWSSLASEQLKAVVKHMQSAFEKEFGLIHKLAKGLRLHMSPAPFASELFSDAQSCILDLVSCLVPTPKSDKINLFLASSVGMEMRDSLICIARKVSTCDTESIANIHDELSTLKKAVHKKSIQFQSSLKAMEADILSLQIQMWPLLDYMALRALSLDSMCGELSPHLQGVIAGAPGVYKELLGALSGPSFRLTPVIGTHRYLAFSQCTATHHTRSFLTYSSSSSDEDTEEHLIDDILHPSACQLTYILLAGNGRQNIGNESTIEEVPSGLHVEKVAQLKSIRSTLWNNWLTLADSSTSYEASFTKASAAFITTTLGAFAITLNIIPEFSIESCNFYTASCLARKIAENSNTSALDCSRKQLYKVASIAEKLQGCHSDWIEKSAIAAHAVLVMGALQTNILGHLEPVDPAQCNNLMLQYHQEELEDLESHLMLSEWLECLSGCHSRLPVDLAHPHLTFFKEKCIHLRKKVHELTQQVAHRPGPSEYHQLRQDFTHFLSTVFTQAKLQELSSTLEECRDTSTPAAVSMKIECMISSCDNFVQRVVRQYPLYRDLTYPLLYGVTMTCEALRLLASHSRLKNISITCGTDLTESLIKYSAFPALREPLHPLRLLNEQLNIAECTTVLLPEDQYPGQAKVTNNLILRAALLDLLNVALAQHHLDDPIIYLATQLFGQIASSWRQQEEEKALRAQEEESLYRYKTRTLAVSETEEEIQDREFNKAFPSFDHEFDDLNDLDLNDNVENESDKPDITGNVSVGHVTDDQIFEVSELHCVIFTSLVRTHWCTVPVSSVAYPPSQVVPAAVLRLRVLHSLLGTAGCIAGCKLDHATIGAQILSNYNSCALLTDASPPELFAHPYDIYRDPNPKEVLKVRPLLQSIRERVDELLILWPDHPSLLMVNTILTRVLAFPLTSPLMRHVVGLETVLEKAQDWEKNAHKGVSMMEQLEAVTHQILEWRQLELNAWSSCLDSVTHRVATEGRKLWPRLHDTFQAALTESVSPAEISTTLKQFLETSILGNFETRLKLLYAFHCNIAVLEKSQTVEQLLTLTWNLHQYYTQFLPLVTSTLAKAKQPIDKDIKGYVKIARWNDINYFAVRESVTKSHRTLHRYMRNWEKKLRQPIASLLCDDASELIQDHTGAWDKELYDMPVSTSLSTIPAVHGMVNHASRATDDSILCRLPSLTHRSHKLACKILQKIKYSSYVDAVEEVTVSIVTDYQELQAAASRSENISASDMRMKQLRSIMQRRRDCLTRVLKSLASMGIMYTRGNSSWHDDDIDSCMTLPPVDINIAHPGIISLKSAREAWPGCVKYLNRCISRHTLLLKALQQPHGDLGPELVKRLRGVSCHLFLLARNQRRSLTHLSDYTRRLRLHLRDLKTVQPHPVPVAKMIGGCEHLHALATSLSLTIAEISILLKTTSSTAPVMLLQDDLAMFQQTQLEDAERNVNEIKDALSSLTQQLASYLKYFKDGQHLVTPEYCKLFLEAVNLVSSEAKKLKDVMKLLSVGDGKMLPLTTQLTHWLTNWYSAQQTLSTLVDTMPDTAKHIVDLNSLECCLTKALLGVEFMYKRHCSDDNIKEGSNDEEFVKNFLTHNLVESLEIDQKNLRVEEVVNRIQTLIYEAENQPDLLNELKASVSLLEQYQAICETVLLQMVCSNRTITKFTTIILAIFQQLAVKGFCRPQELDDEAGGEGATNFQDSEGTGLGEGEGKKDVSERIESEDQLESALKEGESEKPGDSDLKEEDQGIEMNEDFEGKMQDVERRERNEDDSDEEDNDKDDMDKQMGETEKGAEKLDEKLWGDENESEDEGDKNEEEEDGPGDGEVTESKMVANDDNKSKKERDKDQKKKNELEEMDDTREENAMDEDGNEYDDNFNDPYGGEADKESEDENDKMELPDDMQLDDGEAHDEDNDVERDPMEIEEKGVFPEEEREPKEKDEEKGETEEQNKKDETNVDQEITEDQEGNIDEKEKEELSEEAQKDERKEGTEEANVENVETDRNNDESAEASKDKDSKTVAEAAEMDTTEGSKDETKEQPKTDAGGQREEDEEEKQEEQGNIGEQTDDQEGVGQSESRTRDDAHKGESSALVTQASASDQNDMKKPRKPGETDEDRTLGNNEENVQHGLMAKEMRKRETEDDHQHQDQENGENDPEQKNSEYEHITKAEDHFDAQIVDAGTQEQAKEVPAPADRQDKEDKMQDEEILETPMEVDEEDSGECQEENQPIVQNGEKKENHERSEGKRDPQGEGETQMMTEGEIILEDMIQRPPETYFYTLIPDESK
ncbi:LOW QUALITY PROTEIN: midasin-like [Procambarus clarkii]|uniref:LOW QUALITY PROTEIN: midasin-like n=1 Tax=Procambarus clarkii TaxID=6728 RepID=UPI00374286EA